MDADTDLAARLQQIQLPADAVGGVGSHKDGDDFPGPATPRSRAQTPRPRSPAPEIGAQCDVPDAALSVQEIYDIALANTRVYNRVLGREVDAISSVSTSRSRAWSVLSGLSLTQISVIAVVSLPLYEPKLLRFGRLVSSRNSETPGEWHFRDTIDLYGHLTSEYRATFGLSAQRKDPGTKGSGAWKTINRQLINMEREPPSGISAGPIGDDLVCVSIIQSTSIKTDKAQFH